MRALSEDEANTLSGDAECPVLRKEEHDPTEGAVCLKRLPSGYLLGVSDATHDLRLWFAEERAELEAKYQEYLDHLQRHGSFFGGPANVS